MQTKTIFLIILAAVVALLVILFQYYYKTKKRGKLNAILSFLRFIGIFGVLLLLINPKFTKEEFIIEKSTLVLLVDNSTSMNSANETTNISSILNEISNEEELQAKFNLKKYYFGSEINENGNLSFSEKNTNITKAIASINDIYVNTSTSIVLVTDGNQTIGEDYEFYGTNQKTTIFPIAVGDTIRYEDVNISRVNANKYAFLKNKFPVESFISYEGKNNISVLYTIFLQGKSIYKERVSLTSTNNTKVISTLIDAKSVGVKTLKFTLSALQNEKNIVNNEKRVALEVIDEKTNIVIISDIEHPDIGALKKAIEKNEQRSVVIKKPSVGKAEFDAIDVFILYQPNRSFTKIYEYLKLRKPSVFTVTGSATDWNFLNSIQSSFSKRSSKQTEEINAVLNSGFNLFSTSDFSIEGFPPLLGNLGDISINKVNDVLLSQRIRGIDMKEPLLVVLGETTDKEVVLFGEGLWKWRSQSFRNDREFINFDDLIGKIVLYLASNKPKDRLVLDYEQMYSGSNEAVIKASYFDKAFSFDTNASLVLKVKQEGVEKQIPMLFKGNYYEADISDLKANNYNFTVAVEKENISKSGKFIILDFNIEQQFSSTNYKKLNRLAENTKGKLYYPGQVDDLVQYLVKEKQFLPTQKRIEKIVSLVDFKFLLGLIIIAFSAEWFIRKYNGLI
ncbi:MAG: VWA domain-containing protein [Cellulophaga sp.]